MKWLTLITLIAVSGCGSVIGPEPVVAHDYRALVAVATASALMSTDEVVVPVTQECDGSGWITHGDGHRTRCPGCKNCKPQGKTQPSCAAPAYASKPAVDAPHPCECGPGCQCHADPNNPDCKCTKCKCDPGVYETYQVRLRLITTSWCGPCQSIKRSTLPAMKAAGWKIGYGAQNHIELIDNGGGTVPRWERVVNGRVVQVVTGYMNPYQVDKFLTANKEPARRAK